MYLKSFVDQAINNVKMMDVYNISSFIMKFIKPKLYVFHYSDERVIHRENEEDAFIRSNQKAYIFATSPKEAYLIYMHYCKSLNLLVDIYISLEEFENHLIVLNESIKHFTIPRIDNLDISVSMDDNIDESTYIQKYSFKCTKAIKKMLYNCQPLEKFSDIDENRFLPAEVYINTSIRTSTSLLAFDDIYNYDEYEF